MEATGSNPIRSLGKTQQKEEKTMTRVSHVIHNLTDILSMHGDQSLSLTVDGKETTFTVADFGSNTDGSGYTVHLRTVEPVTPAETTNEVAEEVMEG